MAPESTTATFSGEVTLCFTYPDSYRNESQLKLMHREASGTWVNVTTSLDVATNTICGKVTSFSPFIVAEQNQPPVALLNGPYDAGEGSAVAFDASASSDPDGTTLQYAWDFGDGTGSTLRAPTHPYADEGTYQVTLTVTDNYARTASTTAKVTVT